MITRALRPSPGALYQAAILAALDGGRAPHVTVTTRRLADDTHLAEIAGWTWTRVATVTEVDDVALILRSYLNPKDTT